ncbi:hypothetical protein BaRGS_00002270 [Batillaria attramentaria]|uniref:BZIP domain-containing protein n=1 Tax=Batillaria attramentaria TaxID=370345 RepID=A0ABD0M445_9CAEN
MMDMYGMDDFSLLVDDWNLGQSFDFNQFGDVKVTQVKDDHDLATIKTETQVDMLDSFLDTPTDKLNDPFGAEWMENADLLQFLDVAVNNDAVLEQAAVLEAEIQPTASPPVSPAIPEASVSPAVQDKHEVHIASFEFLQSLLKQSEQNMQADAVLPPASSPSPPTSPEAQVAPEIDCLALDLQETRDTGVDLQDVEFIGSPLSADDVESLLSSAAPSPSTVDTSSLYGESTNSSTVTCNSSDLYQLVANVTKGQKSRGSPYSRSQSTSPKTPKSKGRKQTATISPGPSELELELMSKKDRKKLQNKNAAIRYRQKKKEECDTTKSELTELETVNEKLHEKVDQLQREVQYMKDLIQEVQKARGLKTFSI